MRKNKYKAVLFAPDGDWVTDFQGCESIEEVVEKLADMGSSWFFYPFHAIILDKGNFTSARQRIVDAAWPFEDAKGASIRSFARFIAEYPREELEAILGG